MTWFDQLPLQRRLSMTILGICGLVLLLACTALAAYEVVDYRRTLSRDSAVMAEIAAQNVRAALAFDDEAAARDVLDAMKSEPRVIAAAAYAEDGHRFASYVRAGEKPTLPEIAADDAPGFSDGSFHLFRPVLQNGKRLGTLYLRVDLTGIHDRTRLFAGIAALVLLGSCLIALPLSARLQRPISGPILELAAAAERIGAHNDYSVRIRSNGIGEIGVLTQAFNQMVAGIEKSERALSQSNASLRDEIAERKRTEEALAASEKHYRLIFEESPLPKWIHDISTLRFLAVNRAAQEHYGYSEAEFLTLSLRDIRPAEDIPASGDDPAARGGSGQWRHRKKDGSIIHVVVHAHDVDVAGRACRMVVAQDVTEQRLAEEKVRAQLARLAQLNQITRAVGERQDVESIFQAVVRSVEEDMPVDFASICGYDEQTNAFSATRVGARHPELAARLGGPDAGPIQIEPNGLGNCLRGQLIYEPDLDRLDTPLPRTLAAAGLRSFVVTPLYVESKIFGALLVARRNRAAFSSGDCEFLRQLSEHVALAAHQAQLHAALQTAYDDLRQTQQAVMQQERLRALGQMASGIAHDINNAISPVSLYVESILETEKNISPQTREWLTVVSHAVEDVTHTVARLREFYRQREPQLALAPVPLNRVMEEVAQLTQARWQDMPQQRGFVITLQRELEPDLPRVLAVESEIREALINLVFNAVDAMPEGGTLTLRTRIVQRASRGGSVAPHPHVAVEVSDTGIGMDEDTRRRCLEPFFTTKGERGTGLGLAMVYGIAGRHRADLEIDSAPGRGTTVRLILAASTAVDAKPGERAPEQKPHTRLRLLIVDDDPMLLKSLRDTLESDGHVVDTANGGQAGINAFLAVQDEQHRFAAVITDLGMPYVDGRKVATAIKGASPATPVIMLTGWGQRLVEDGEIPPHVDRVLSKPPKLRELRAVLRAVGEGNLKPSEP